MTVRAVERILTALVIALFIPGVFLTIADLLPLPPQVDFAAYYLAAEALRAGLDPYDPGVANALASAAHISDHTPYIYPPLLAMVLVPLTALPFRAAAAIWLALSAIALVLALRLLQRIFNLQPRMVPWAMVLTFFFPAVHHTLELGQINNFLLLLIVAAALEARAVISAVLVGIAGALKVFPAALGAVFLLNRNVAALTALVATGGLLTAVGLISASNGRPVGDWLYRVAPGITAERLVTPNNQSLQAVSLRTFQTHTFEGTRLSVTRSTTVTLPALIERPALAPLVAGAAAIAVGISTGWVLVITRKAPGQFANVTRFSVLVATLLMVLPVVWDHYYVLLLLPMAVLYRMRDVPGPRMLLLASGVLILAHRYWRLTLYARSPLLLAAGLAGVFLMWTALLWALRHQDRRPAIINVSSKGVLS